MSEINFINTFFNIIYQNETAYIRDLMSSYDYLLAFCDWLSSRNINCQCLRKIQKNDYSLLNNQLKLCNIEIILHLPLKEYFEKLSKKYLNKVHMIYIPGCNHNVDINYKEINYKNAYIYIIHDKFYEDDLSFFDPFPAFFCAINHADEWPGVLVFQNEKGVFIPLKTNDEFKNILDEFDQHVDLFTKYNDFQDDLYFIQLSDLHLGSNKKEKGLKQLYQSLNGIIPKLYTNSQIQFLITGDLMESPNRKNMYLANDFMNHLKKEYKANVTFILGNHDMIVHGVNIARRQKSKVIAYLLGENVRIFEKEKIIIIKMDTCSEGYLARGKVGQRQLDEIDDELSAIEKIEDYTLIVMLHHHVYPLSKAQFIKTKWHEKTFINRLVETSKVLVDAPLLIEWLKQRKIKYIFHGHKHLPYFREKDGSYYIGAGSATGGLKESKSRYISYNIVRYNQREQKMKTCMIFYDDKAKAERQRIEVNVFKEKK